MLRSMMIGLVIASLLQFGAKSFAPAPAMAPSARTAMQAQAIDRLVCQGYALLSRETLC